MVFITTQQIRTLVLWLAMTIAITSKPLSNAMPQLDLPVATVVLVLLRVIRFSKDAEAELLSVLAGTNAVSTVLQTASAMWASSRFARELGLRAIVQVLPVPRLFGPIPVGLFPAAGVAAAVS